MWNIFSASGCWPEGEHSASDALFLLRGNNSNPKLLELTFQPTHRSQYLAVLNPSSTRACGGNNVEILSFLNLIFLLKNISMRPCVTLTIDTVCIQQKKKDIGKILWLILWLYLFYIFCAVFWYLMDFCKIYCAKTRLRWTLPVTVKNIELCDAHCGGKLKPRFFHHQIHFFGIKLLN